MKHGLRPRPAFAALPTAAAFAAFLLAACGGSMTMQKPEQGISGTFTAYGPPPVLLDCGSLVTQADKDSCKGRNNRVVEEPYRSTIRIRNLSTGENLDQALDGNGAYRVVLNPGEYEVCVNGECSDPLEVRVGRFATYGQRLPRPAADPAEAARKQPGPPPGP